MRMCFYSVVEELATRRASAKRQSPDRPSDRLTQIRFQEESRRRSSIETKCGKGDEGNEKANVTHATRQADPFRKSQRDL